ITYRERRGRASAYVWSAEGDPAAFGAVRNRVLAGTAAEVPIDETGPRIEIAFQGQEPFVSGGAVSPQPVLRAHIHDESGINITGEIGHEIELDVDGRVFRVTDAFITQPGGYGTGLVEYELPQLEPGEYTVRLKAWDAFNNSSQAQVQVRVSKGKDFALSALLVYPNPLRDQGYFTYLLAVPALAVDIQIYTLSGRLVDRFPGGTRSGYNQVAWEKPSDLANGTYLFRIRAELEDGGGVERTAALQVVQ
ncbi:MAG: T9SS type A sorting domain-containing protein, partial [Anaerolineae bacterium]|nr:T9SS type A sorting domain-containing protein [Anaerolineae bacterium]